jgi:hypothetical protein
MHGTNWLLASPCPLAVATGLLLQSRQVALSHARAIALLQAQQRKMAGLSDQVEQLSADKARLEGQVAEQATANGLLTGELNKLRAVQQEAEAQHASLMRDMDALQVSAAVQLHPSLSL